MSLTKKDLEQIGELMDQKVGGLIDEKVGDLIDQKVGGLIDEKVGGLIDEKQEKLAGMIAREFQNINEHFKRMHQRFSDVDLSIEKLTRRVQNLELAIIENREQHRQFDKRLEALYGKVDGLDQKVDALDQKGDGLDQKVDALDGRVSKVETELREIKHRMDRLSKKREDWDEQAVVRLTNRVDQLESVVFA